MLMKIAFVDCITWNYKVESVYQRALGGSQSALCYLAEALVQQGHEVFLFNRTQSPSTSCGVRCLPLSSMSGKLPNSLNAVITINGSPEQGKAIKALISDKIPLILWLHHAHDLPAMQNIERAGQDVYDYLVLVSNWQRDEYKKHFNIDLDRTIVLQNAIGSPFNHLFADGTPILDRKSKPPILAYTSTPFRGLDILLDLFPEIRRRVPGTRLKVFSSLKVYQIDEDSDRSVFGELYDRCMTTEGVEYIGSISQPNLARELQNVTMLAYPSTYLETSCLAVMEAMASGCLVVSSHLGALPETTAGFAHLISPIEDDIVKYKDNFIDRTTRILEKIISSDRSQIEKQLQDQVQYINLNYNWSIRSRQWVDFLESIQQLLFQPSASQIDSLSMQAYEALIQGDYQAATDLYEQAIEFAPTETLNYWYLGLTLLLQGQEVEAQTTWLSVVMEADGEQEQELINNLVQILETEAERLEDLEDFQNVWLIRQHIREVQPIDLKNLLKLISVSIREDFYLDHEAIVSQLLEALELAIKNDTLLDLKLIQASLQTLWKFYPGLNFTIDLTERCLRSLPRLEHSNYLAINFLSQASVWLQSDFLPKIVLVRYAELYLYFQPDNLPVLVKLINLYQDTQQYKKNLELAQKFIDCSQNLADKIAAHYLMLRGLMKSGGSFTRSLELQQSYQDLLLELVNSQSDLSQDHVLQAISTTTFFSYFDDDPKKIQYFRQKLSVFLKDRIQKLFSFSHSNISRFSRIDRQKQKFIKIGYLSSCLCRHSVGYLARWTLLNHNRTQFQTYAYSLKRTDDEIQQSIARSVSVFHDLSQGQTIPEIAELIYQDEIDILVDLDSLTSSTACAVMALKPAPIQVTWLGFDAAELPTVDYFIADPYVLPETAQDYYSETIWRLPQTYIAVDGFEVGVPTLRREQLEIPTDAVVYFSSQTGAKRHPDNVRLQMRILKEVPNSYFLIKGLYTDVESVKRFFEEIAAEEGVKFERLRFLSDVPSEAVHRANLAISDVVLDTYPYNGTTTTLETLWMGVPVVTRVGQQFASRQGYTLLMNVGVTEGIAWTDEQYVEWGVRLGKNAALRQEVSWKLRMSRHSSPLWKAEKFTRDLEAAYTQMWEMYLKSQR
jgi:predicted O-linked N-acetylglucosamine transferase (SPINDLY family)/glycosyltransferase involved in cell wall biosynthesis